MTAPLDAPEPLAPPSARGLGAVARGVYTRLQAWHVRLFHQKRHRHLALEQVVGRPFLVLPDVLNPKLLRSGELLGRTLEAAGPELLRPGARVLDMGTGSGVGGVVAAGRGAHVVAVDVNPEAVRCARINALLNRVEDRMEVREGDLFAPLGGEQFDLVVFNPPYLRGTPKDLLERAFYATDVVERFAEGLAAHLAPGGQTLLLLSSHGEVGPFLGRFRERGFQVELHTQVDLVSEWLMVYLLRLPRR